MRVKRLFTKLQIARAAERKALLIFGSLQFHLLIEAG